MKKPLQRGFASTQHDIVDRVVFQIAKGGCIALAARKEMLIDAQDSRAPGVGSLGCQAFEHVLEPAFDGGASQSFALTQPAPADPVPVPPEDHASKQLGRPLPLQNPWKLLPEAAATSAAQPLVRFQD